MILRDTATHTLSLVDFVKALRTAKRLLIQMIALSLVFISVASAQSVPTYNPILVDDLELETGSPSAWYANGRQTVFYTSERSLSGERSARIEFTDGSNWFGGHGNMPQSVEYGETVWYRVYLYIPSTTSFSSGGVLDYSGWGKFLVLSRISHNGPRMYTQLRAAKQKDYGDSEFYGSGLRVDSDGMGTCNLPYPALPRDRWFSLQIAWKLEVNGWVRLWVGEEFVGECASKVDSSYSVQNYGIGDYWNGEAWVKNLSTAHFYVDDVVITKQQPNRTDAGGRPYIHPEDFLAPVVRPRSPQLLPP